MAGRPAPRTVNIRARRNVMDAGTTPHISVPPPASAAHAAIRSIEGGVHFLGVLPGCIARINFSIDDHATWMRARTMWRTIAAVLAVVLTAVLSVACQAAEPVHQAAAAEHQTAAPVSQASSSQ